MTNSKVQDLDPNSKGPIAHFHEWYSAALESGIKLPESVALATVNNAGIPTIRFVLLRGYDERGFKFYTNYQSRKAKEIESNPNVGLCFHWTELERQVRIDGRVEKTSTAESDEYWETRPRESQIGAHASNQSAPLARRDELDERMTRLTKQFEGKKIPRPENWGGFRLQPNQIEFWQGQRHRLHDRLVYIRENNSWITKRIQP